MDEESKRQRIAILNVLAGYYIKLAVKSKDAQRDQFYDLATNNYNKADKIDVQQEMTWVGKGAVSTTRCAIVHTVLPLCWSLVVVLLLLAKQREWVRAHMQACCCCAKARLTEPTSTSTPCSTATQPTPRPSSARYFAQPT